MGNESSGNRKTSASPVTLQENVNQQLMPVVNRNFNLGELLVHMRTYIGCVNDNIEFTIVKAMQTTGHGEISYQISGFGSGVGHGGAFMSTALRRLCLPLHPTCNMAHFKAFSISTLLIHNA